MKYFYKRYFSSRILVFTTFVLVFSCYRPDSEKLQVAASTGELQKVRVLLETGSDPNLVDNMGQSALHHLCSKFFEEDPRSDTSLILLMVKKGADLNLRDYQGNTPLVYAIRAGNLGAVKSLIYHGADVNIRNLKMRTPLFDAVSFIIAGPEETNSLKYVKLLFNAGADLNVLDAEKKNLIHASRNPAVTAWLIAHGVNFKQKDKFGKTPLDYSSEKIFEARDAIVKNALKRKS